MTTKELKKVLGVGRLNFGEVLVRLRKRGNLGIREMGAAVDIDAAYILRLESGEKQNPTKRIVGRIALALMMGDPAPSMWELAELYQAVDLWPFFLDMRDLKIPDGV